MPFTDYMQFDYNGGAVATTVPGRLADNDIVITVADGSTYPLANDGKLAAITINEGEIDEERVYYGPRVGNDLQNCIRGADNTQPVGHDPGAVVTHGITAKDSREANALVSVFNPTQAAATNGLVGAFSTDNAAAANALTATINPAQAAELVPAASAWTAFTPTFGIASGSLSIVSNTSVVARYKKIGTVCTFTITSSMALTGANPGVLQVTLPLTAVETGFPLSCVFQNDLALAFIADSTHAHIQAYGGNSSTTVILQGDGVARGFNLTGTYEVAP